MITPQTTTTLQAAINREILPWAAFAEPSPVIATALPFVAPASSQAIPAYADVFAMPGENLPPKSAPANPAPVASAQPTPPAPAAPVSFKQVWEKVVLIAPAISLIGGLGMLASAFSHRLPPGLQQRGARALERFTSGKPFEEKALAYLASRDWVPTGMRSTFERWTRNFQQQTKEVVKEVAKPSWLDRQAEALRNRLEPWARTNPFSNGALKLVNMVSPEPVQLTEAQAAFKSQVSKASWNVLASGRFFSAINGISQGIISMQPSMVLCNIGQLLVTTPMFSIAGATQSQRLKTLAASLDMFFGGLYTVGFATEIANKSKPENDPTVRVYDMSRLKQAFIPSSGMNIAQRASAIGKELVGMTVFAAQDHVDLVKNLVKDNTSIARSIANPNTWRRKDEALYPDLETDSRFNVNDLAKPSANKSRIAAMLTYAGTLPIVLLNTRIPDIGNKFIPQLLKGGAMLTANLSLFTLALNRDDWKGRAPLLGVPLSVIGNAKANNDFFVGIGQIGEAMNNLFFSDMAVNGLKRIKPKKQHSLFNAGKVNSVNGQILMGQGPESVNVEG